MSRNFKHTGGLSVEVAARAVRELGYVTGGRGAFIRERDEGIARRFGKSWYFARASEAKHSKLQRVSLDNHRPGDRQLIAAAEKRKADAEKWIKQLRARKVNP